MDAQQPVNCRTARSTDKRNAALEGVAPMIDGHPAPGDFLVLGTNYPMVETQTIHPPQDYLDLFMGLKLDSTDHNCFLPAAMPMSLEI